jgi:hypothetical protein
MGRWGRGSKGATTPVTDWDGSSDEASSDLKDASRKFSWLSGRGGVAQQLRTWIICFFVFLCFHPHPPLWCESVSSYPVPFRISPAVYAVVGPCRASAASGARDARSQVRERQRLLKWQIHEKGERYLARVHRWLLLSPTFSTGSSSAVLRIARCPPVTMTPTCMLPPVTPRHCRPSRSAATRPPVCESLG